MTEEPFTSTNEFEYEDAFNNTSFHSFRNSKITELNQEFWNEKPKYQTDTELIQSHIIN